jgi:glutamyl-tRNA synthetase
MTIKVRFAPSPTGRLHIGNARLAVFNWLFARAREGAYVLRLDDTDRERSTAEFADGIVHDLAWLGIRPDETVAQSDRLALYDAAAGRLRAAGRLYPCYETADELDRRRKRQMARGLPPIYDRAALKLTAEERAALEAQGRRPHWRFLLEARGVVFHDLVRGEVRVNADSLSDPVLIREDGSYLYTLPSIVDDAELGITHVIRGEDHVVNTGVQIELFEALGATPPTFAHVNLLTTTTGEGLSKRTGALSLKSLREDGVEPMAVAALAVLVGTSKPVEPFADMDALASAVSLSDVSHGAAKFDPAELEALNARIVHALPYPAVAERLAALGVGGGATFWDAVKGNLVRVRDAADWWPVVAGPLAPVIDDPAFAAGAMSLLPPEPWDETTFPAWADAVKGATGAKGKALFMPLRRALTARDHGPELKTLLPLIGRARVLARLAGETA